MTGMSSSQGPSPEPYDQGHLAVGDGHHLYWEVCGNPMGKAAVVLHGGPGSGATPYWRQFFDPSRYRYVLFDQRGCGRSTPHAGDDVAALQDNTTAHLVADIERLREHLSVDRWLVLGASWGSTLGLAYAIQHPERVSELVLWAVVTTRAAGIAWLTHVMGQIFPEEFDQLVASLPEGRSTENIPRAFNELLRSDDPDVRDAAAVAWCAWEDRIATLSGPVRTSQRFRDPRTRLGFARLVTHYFGNAAFLPDDAIVGSLERLTSIPAYLLRGRLDIASPLRAAYEIAQRLPLATLDIVEPDAHAAGDETTQLLKAAVSRFAG
jgi:proline iminopeptidase